MEEPGSITPAGGEDSNTVRISGSEVGSGNTGEHENESPSFETVAKEKGWRPKEEYEGEVDNWIGAEEFIKRQPLFDKIKIQNKKLKELEKTVDALAKHYQTNIQQAKERAILDLKSERREAIELGEVDKVEEIDQKMMHVHQMVEPVVPTKGIAPEIEQFVDDNRDWFNKDEEMTSFAVAYNETALKKGLDMQKSLDETLKAVKRAFPDKFANQRRQSPPPVEGGTTLSKGEGKYSVARLNNEQKIVYNQLVKVHKQMSHDDYFKSLDQAGYLE